MQKLYDLKDRLCEELSVFSTKELNSSNLEKIDTLAHAIKNIGKIIEMDGEDYSERGMSHIDSSFARGRGRNARRDSMGRYASDGYSRDLHDMTKYLPPEKREEMERILAQMDY